MEKPLRWYDRRPLSRPELEQLVADGRYKKMVDISPGNPKQSSFVSVGDKLAVLMTNGLVQHYTITSLKSPSGIFLVGRDEDDMQEKGREFCVDSSMSDIYDVGYKVVDKFPWE